MKAFLLTLIFIFNITSYASELYTVGEGKRINSLPSRFYTQLQRVQKEYVEASKFETRELLYLETDKDLNKSVAYYSLVNKNLINKKSVKDFESEYIKLNNLKKVSIYYEENKNKPNQIFSLEEHGNYYFLKNLSTGEYVKFYKNISEGISTVFGAEFYKHRYVNIFSASEREIAIIVDGKFYFYIKN
ncbi:MAG: hypothetical protein IPM57_06780 [Oligoflexia bacterium]|nr:hypothetical protein [Oligoflexia bacterium]